jgi:hypothetical protein
MSTIQAGNEHVRMRMHECTEAGADRFRASVRPIFASLYGLRPELIGSCVLLEVDGAKFAVTAAHIIDWVSSHALFVAGMVGTQPVQMLGDIKSTPRSKGSRASDRFDFAFWQVSASAEKDLGAVDFLDQTRISRNRISTIGRLYMAMGYPLSKNRGKVDNVSRAIRIVLWKYSANVVELPELAMELGASGDEHFFLRFEKHSHDSRGTKVNTISPRGISGGALVDLGSLASISDHPSEMRCAGMLAGLVIERHEAHRALVAVKIGTIVDAIKRQRAADLPNYPQRGG